MNSVNVASEPIVTDEQGMWEQVAVIHVGLGPIGRQVAEYLADRRIYRSAGAIDVDPDIVGRSLGEIVATRPEAGDVPIVETIDELNQATPGAVAIHCAGSSLALVTPTLMRLVESGYHVVSTCEELSNPWKSQPELAAQIDRAAKKRGVVVLGTGVNPGYSMDYLPVVLAGSQRSVRAVSVHRVQDAGARRLPLQRKVGAGITVDEFTHRVQQGTIKHMGLPESAQIIDRALALGCDEFTETIDPIVADRATPLGDGQIDQGRALGIDQLVLGMRAGATLVRLHLQMAVGLDDPRDLVTLEGEPGLQSVVRGLHGDTATAAVVVNALGRVRTVPPGLRAVDELPPSPLNL